MLSVVTELRPLGHDKHVLRCRAAPDGGGVSCKNAISSRHRRLATLSRILQIYTEDMAERIDPLDGCAGFAWDEGNAEKNWEQHRVTPEEAEDVFFNEPLVIRSDVRHSKKEKRHYALGHTSRGRMLFIAFTIRGRLLRVISARDMNRRERSSYAKHEEEADS
jgi:uncharacterized DUF497 family protein